MAHYGPGFFLRLRRFFRRTADRLEGVVVRMVTTTAATRPPRICRAATQVAAQVGLRRMVASVGAGGNVAEVAAGRRRWLLRRFRFWAIGQG